ncbi:3-isopropylmalate dehydrogenase [uncultured Clostridium sp.]|uniref:3-isopropylmalate dehydrogenase n=1 Tax=uncultured Clostridium sp. TaxID=59620 RepID=UPI002630C90F|nr:3-isopropylmalate dehydrogenase [uncultured Clostridium sp.]
MEYKIAVIPGDGIGPEVINESLKVLDKIGEKFRHKFKYKILQAGGCAIDTEGVPLPEATLEECRKSDGVIMGAIGGVKWDNPTAKVRPEQAILGLREGLNLYCNLRPIILHKTLKEASPLKNSIIEEGIDILVVRELTGGIYFGERATEEINGIREAYDTLKYNEVEIKRIAKLAFESAMKRDKKVTSIDKANVLDSSRLWRKVVEEVALEYPEITVNHLYIDNGAMQLIRNPKQFDVILTDNMFGDILSDEGSMITGSIGMLPSASLGENSFGLYEPIHGSAPDIAGKGIANPLATILSTSMMLRYTLGLETEGKAIENAVTKVLEKGYRTADIISKGMTLVKTKEMGNLVIKELMEG